MEVEAPDVAVCGGGCVQFAVVKALVHRELPFSKLELKLKSEVVDWFLTFFCTVVISGYFRFFFSHKEVRSRVGLVLNLESILYCSLLKGLTLVLNAGVVVRLKR